MTDQTSIATNERQTILEDFRSSHRELLRFMDEVDRIAGTQPIDEVELSATRWKLSQARRRNKALVHAFLEAFPASLRAVHGEIIAAMLGQSAKAMQDTARHSSRWSPRAIAQDPRGYRDAIQPVRREWVQTIDLERQLIDVCGDLRSAAA